MQQSKALHIPIPEVHGSIANFDMGMERPQAHTVASTDAPEVQQHPAAQTQKPFGVFSCSVLWLVTQLQVVTKLQIWRRTIIEPPLLRITFGYSQNIVQSTSQKLGTVYTALDSLSTKQLKVCLVFCVLAVADADVQECSVMPAAIL